MKSDNISWIDEPTLEFRYGQNLIDPHDGLSVFGPFDADQPSSPKQISYGIVGTQYGINECSKFIGTLNTPILIDDKSTNAILWPPFPGFSTCFESKMPNTPTHIHVINDDKLLKAATDLDQNKRTGSVVDFYIEGIKHLIKYDDKYDVIICVIPEIVFKNCRPMSTLQEGTGDRISAITRRFRKIGHQNLFDCYKQEHYTYSVDFRRQIKARSMEFGVPIQIIRDTTFITEKNQGIKRGLTPLSDRAWNLSVGLYYKAGGKPWKLSSTREGVCYVGIAYKRTGDSEQSRTACSAAQMFLDSGDGLVLMGEYGQWYSPISKECHLDRQAAKRLLSKVLETYNALDGKPLNEIFLHCMSSIDEEEFNGFKDACPKDTKIIGIRIKKQQNSIRLFREGKNPVLRGTYWRLSDQTCLLWASGYKPRIATYDGWETPLPLSIDIQHGDADIDQVAKDILGLTKLSYNSCKFSMSEPVTIGFSKSVGEILVSNPTVIKAEPKFKFYI